jgi:hypothetical protein
MRCFLFALLSVNLLTAVEQTTTEQIAAAEKSTPAPITISCGDVPAWWHEFSQTWFGQAFLSPACAPERQFVLDFFTTLEKDTSIAVPWSADQLQAFVFQRDGDGALLSLRIWGNKSGDEILAQANAACERQQQQRHAAWKKQRENNPLTQNNITNERLAKYPLEKIKDGFIFLPFSDYRLYYGTTASAWHAKSAHDASDWWYGPALAQAQPATRPEKKAAASVSFSLPAVLCEFGLPLLFNELAEAKQCTATIAFQEKNSHETLSMPYALSALTPLDWSRCAAALPENAWSVNACSVDGAALSAWILAQHQHTPKWTISHEFVQLIAHITGPVWFAVTDGLPLPDVVVGIPANPALDDTLNLFFTAQQIQHARKKTQSIKIKRSPIKELFIKRSETTWYISTGEAALTALGNTTIPAPPNDALIYGWQDNKRILHSLALKLGAASVALNAQLFMSKKNDEKPMLDQQLSLITKAARWCTAFEQNAETSSWHAQRDGESCVFTGQNATLALTHLPQLLGAARYILPACVPELAVHSTVLSLADQTKVYHPHYHHKIREEINSLNYLFGTAITRNLLYYGSSSHSQARALQYAFVYHHLKKTKIEFDFQTWLNHDDTEIITEMNYLIEQGWLFDAFSFADYLPRCKGFLAHSDARVRETTLKVIPQFAFKRDMSNPATFSSTLTTEQKNALAKCLHDGLNQEKEALLISQYLSALIGFQDDASRAVLRRYATSADATTRYTAYFGLVSFPDLNDEEISLIKTGLTDNEFSFAQSTIGDLLVNWLIYYEEIDPRILSQIEELLATDKLAAFPNHDSVLQYLLRKQSAVAIAYLDNCLANNHTGRYGKTPFIKSLELYPKPAGETYLLNVIQSGEKEQFIAMTSLAKRETLSESAIDALIPGLLNERDYVRKEVRKGLNKRTMSLDQKKKFQDTIEQGLKKYGERAYGEKEVPKPAPTDVNDF